jgi:NAD(P)-dependent dehydrogenase (short-subunit alcohol dehydrogenase family)
VTLGEDLVDLSNRTVLVVGGTSGIGREPARRFAAAGSTVAVGGRNPEALVATADQEGVNPHALPLGDLVAQRSQALVMLPGREG